jgi:hypothetical protein
MVVIGLVALGLTAALTVGRTPHAAASAPLALHVSGNHLLDANNVVVVPRGVNRSGSEYQCVQGGGVFDGPSDQASITAMASWGVKSVRVPLNEDCWLGINGANPGGAAYQTAIVNYVNLLHVNGMYAEITLMWTAPGTQLATFSNTITDSDHSPAAWTSIANTFKSDGDTFFGLLNEPHNVSAQCWRDGGSACSVGFAAAGAQTLINAIRGTGATNVISDQCIDYANNCSQWLQFEPNDPLHQLIAEAHVYGKNTCDTTACFDSQIAPVAAVVPVIFGETGETFDGSDCNNSSTNISTFMNWADSHGVGYQAWVWDTWGSCNLSLITSYDGTPFGVYGNFVKTHLLAEAGNPPPPPTPPPCVQAVSGVSESNSPTPVPQGSVETFHMTYTQACASPMTVAWDIYSGSTLIHQIAQVNVAGVAGANTQTATYTIPSTMASGTYSITVGIWGPNWSPNYQFINNAGTLTVGNPPPPPVQISNVPCTVTLNGAQQTGHCSGTFQP